MGTDDTAQAIEGMGSAALVAELTASGVTGAFNRLGLSIDDVNGIVQTGTGGFAAAAAIGVSRTASTMA